MPEFEMRNPFENKKLQPFLIAGVVVVAAFVLLTKRSGSNADSTTSTEYQQTYATNTGVTTQVSTMLEDYKEQVSDMLAENQAATDDKLTTQNENILQYMDELNSMFDEKHAAWDDEYDSSMDALNNQLEKLFDEQSAAMENMQSQFEKSMDAVEQQMGDMKNDTASSMGLLSGIINNLQSQLTGISNKQDALAAEQNRQNALAQERSEANNASAFVQNYYSNPTNNTSKSYSDYNVTNGRDTNYNDDGTAFLTQGLFDMMADMSGNSSTSHSDYTNANYKYYYEDAASITPGSIIHSPESESNDLSCLQSI